MDKNQELEALFQTVQSIYFQNINFLKKNYPLLHKKILDFEGKKEENYFLEFIDNHFELINLDNKRTYNVNPFFDAQKRLDRISIENSFQLIQTKTIKNAVHYKNKINAYELINKYIKNIDFNNISHLKKFIFIGTLLGVHINDFHKNIKAEAYLILEDNIEIFRLSLFLCDYSDLKKEKNLFFCINEDEKRKKDIIIDFLSYKRDLNNFIGFEVSDEKALNNIDIITQQCIDFDPYNYPFSEYLCLLERGYHYLKNSNNGLLKVNKIYSLFEKPILFLGSGPSLKTEFEWVKKHFNRFIIVCSASLLKRLETYDLIPDIIISVDGQEEIVKEQFEVNKKYYQNSIIFTSIKTDENVINKIDSKNLFFFQTSFEVIKESSIFSGVTVGDVGLKLLLKLGAKKIFLLGYDACLSKKGETHDSFYRISKIDTENHKLKVKGNFTKEVFTIPLYLQMIDSINSIQLSEYKNPSLYNLSNGAYFKIAKPLKSQDIKIEEFSYIDKNLTKNMISKNLSQISTKELCQNDIKQIYYELKILHILEKNNEKNFIKNSFNLASKYDASLTLQIVIKFFQLLLPYNNKISSRSSLLYEDYKKLISRLLNIYNNIK